jgi:hypothetical protein
MHLPLLLSSMLIRSDVGDDRSAPTRATMTSSSSDAFTVVVLPTRAEYPLPARALPTRLRASPSPPPPDEQVSPPSGRRCREERSSPRRPNFR